MVYYLRLHFFEFWLCNSASPCLLAQFASNKPQQHYLWSTQDNAINLTTLKHGRCGSGSIPCIYWHWIPNLSVEVVMGTIATLPTEVANESWHTHTKFYSRYQSHSHLGGRSTTSHGNSTSQKVISASGNFLHLETFSWTEGNKRPLGQVKCVFLRWRKQSLADYVNMPLGKQPLTGCVFLPLGQPPLKGCVFVPSGAACVEGSVFLRWRKQSLAGTVWVTRWHRSTWGRGCFILWNEDPVLNLALIWATKGWAKL